MEKIPDVTIRECTTDDLTQLQQISCKTYDETFADINTKDNMKTYLEKAFNLEKLQKDLSDCNSLFCFLYDNKKLAGYIKLNEYQTQNDVHDPKSLEIERIYLIKEFQGKGLGQVLMDKAIDIAGSGGKTYIWLGVWEKNNKAIRFYKKNGFYEIGKHPFSMGEDEQTDYIMRKDLI